MRLHKSRANEARRDDLDSIFQERRRKITLVGKLSKSSRRCFGNVPPWRLQTSASRQPTQAAFWGCQEYRHAHFHHSSSLACKGRGGRSAHYLSWVGAFIRSLFSLVGRAPAQQAGGHGLESHRRLCMLVQANPMRLHKSRANETRRDDLDSIFQERRRKITLVGKLSKSSRRCNVPPWRLQTSASPTAHTGSVLGLSGVSARALPPFQQPCLQGKGGGGALCTLPILSWNIHQEPL